MTTPLGNLERPAANRTQQDRRTRRVTRWLLSPFLLPGWLVWKLIA
jgi:hypothetical protein